MNYDSELILLTPWPRYNIGGQIIWHVVSNIIHSCLATGVSKKCFTKNAVISQGLEKCEMSFSLCLWYSPCKKRGSDTRQLNPGSRKFHFL